MTADRKSNGYDPERAHELLDRDLINVVYQPIVHLASGTVLAHEALCRTASPHFNEARDIIDAFVEIGRMGEAGRVIRKLATRNCPETALSINVEPAEFDEGWLVRPDDPIFVHRKSIFLEITESVPLEYFEQCHAIVEEVRRRGIKLAVDDLGAGYSNLKYISDLQPDVVKLDRKLLAGTRVGTRDHRLLRSIVRLVHEMKAEAVAEGIETPEELYSAREAGVDYCQGFFLARPSFPPPHVPWPID